VDETLVFSPFDKEDIRRIVDIQRRAVEKRLAERRITVKLDEAAKEHLAREGYDPAYGARPLKRAIQKLLIDPMAKLLLTGEVKDSDRIAVSAGKAGLVFKAVSPKESKAT
jgi:ATP-dependent Clp protease ATP-binding subunit ClpB